MKQLKQFFLQFRYELSLFCALASNFLLFFTKEQIMTDAIYPIHLVDTKFGFISRTFVGTITGFLWEHPTKNQVAFFHSLIVLLTFASVAVFFGKCIRNADEKLRTPLLLLCLFFTVSPYGFRTYINLFDLLDIYWVLCAALCLLATDNKKTVFLIPLFIFLGEWVHFTFFLAFMPLIYILCFNKCLKEKNRNYYILTGIMLIVSVSATLYFSFTSHYLKVSDFTDFADYIIEKAGDKITKFEVYCGEQFRSPDDFNYDFYIEKLGLPEWVKYETSAFKKGIYTYFFLAFIDGSLSKMIADYILASPLIAFFIPIWHKACKVTADKKERFIYFLCLITPLVGVFSTIFSSDTSRWLSIMLIQNLFLLTLFIKEKSSPVADAFFDIYTKLEKHKTIILFVVLFWLSIVFVW